MVTSKLQGRLLRSSDNLEWKIVLRNREYFSPPESIYFNVSPYYTEPTDRRVDDRNLRLLKKYFCKYTLTTHLRCYSLLEVSLDFREFKDYLKDSPLEYRIPLFQLGRSYPLAILSLLINISYPKGATNLSKENGDLEGLSKDLIEKSLSVLTQEDHDYLLYWVDTLFP